MRRRAIGALVFAGVAASSAGLGYYAQRRALAGVDPEAHPTWAELREPIHGRPVTVRSFDGTRLHAEVLGRDDAPTLVLAHGFALSQHAWHYQRRDLQERFRLVCYDQRGHAGSAEPPTGDYSARALGRDLAAVLHATIPDDEPFVAVGHSMGGMTIMSFADQFPGWLDRLAGVALVSTTAGNVVSGGAFSAGAAALSVVRGRAVAGLRLGRGRARPAGEHDPAAWDEAPPADLAYLLVRTLGLNPGADPAHVAFTERLMLECPRRVKAALGPTLTSLDLIHVPQRLTVPGIVLVGDHDRLTPLRQAHRLADAMPAGRLRLLRDVGHMAPLEAHATVTAEIRGLAEDVLGQ